MKPISKKFVVGTVAASLVLGSGFVGQLHRSAFVHAAGTLSPQVTTESDIVEQQDHDHEAAGDATGEDQEGTEGEE